ncbi:hypothetical protein K432DRAFT_286346, partial [Lepidopterella palustris CBS 459.81]
LKNILIFCEVYFRRSIIRAVGQQTTFLDVYDRMLNLLNYTSREEYMQACDVFIKNKNKTIVNWVLYKKHEVIVVGLNVYCSLISPEIYRRI